MISAISAPMGRDYRIDFFRGLALISIFVNHIPGNFYSNFTHRNFGLSDAAELFVLLAGMSASLAYFPRFLTGRAALSLGLIVKRIGTIYIAHLSAVAIGFTIYAVASLWLDNPALLQPDERHWIVDSTVQAMAGIGLLTYQTGNFNILPMYVGLMLMLPLIMVLARINLKALVGASVALWLGANLFRLNLPNFPGSGGWYFNPLTWQVLFTLGFVCGVMLRRGDTVSFSKTLYYMAVAYLGISFVLVFGRLWDLFPNLPQWFWLSGFDKSWVGIFRLLHVLSLGYVVLFSPIPAKLKELLRPDNRIVSLGRNTLPVFWVSTVLSVVGHIIREDVFNLPNDPTFTPAGIALDTVMIATGLVALFLLARFLDWTKPAAKSRPAAIGALNQSDMVAAE